MKKENKPIKRKKGRYIIQEPCSSAYPMLYPDMTHTVNYYETTHGWDWGYSGDVRLLLKTYKGDMEKILQMFGFSLECASEIVHYYRHPEKLKILDTETMTIVEPLKMEDLNAGKPKSVIQYDLFGNEYAWGDPE